MRMMHPKQRPECHDQQMEFYITAYALAVKGGYSGTVEAWLQSLKGPKGETGEPWTWEDYTAEQLQAMTEGIRAYTMERLQETIDGVDATGSAQTGMQAGSMVRSSFAQQLQEAVAAARTAKENRGRPQRISSGNWWLWDPAEQQYKDSGIQAVGVGGAEGPQGNRGQPGPVVLGPGQMGYYIDTMGRLVVVYEGDTPPDLRIENGLLIMRWEET